MANNGLFIVIEGLDGSGKTSVSRQLANLLNYKYPGLVKRTFEPHDPSCAGLFIRQVLTKKIRRFSPHILPLAFAANRLDHCARLIQPWLDGADNRIVISDRYYLSSLVYQSSADFPYASVMALNRYARRPDVIFFINASDKVCYERMKIRNQPEELFENILDESRRKFLEAIAILRETTGDYIVEIDGDGSIPEVAAAMLGELGKLDARWAFDPASIPSEATDAPRLVSGQAEPSYRIADFTIPLEPDADRSMVERMLAALPAGRQCGLFLDYLKKLGYTVGSQMPGITPDCYELEYTLPPKLVQRGAALFLPEPQRQDLILQALTGLFEWSDFVLIFAPGPEGLAANYYERDHLHYTNGHGEMAGSLSPNIHWVTETELAGFIYETCCKENIYP